MRFLRTFLISARLPPFPGRQAFCLCKLMSGGREPDDGMLKEAEVPNVIERVSYVEGQVNELSLRLSGVETAIVRLEQRIDTRFDAVDRRFFWIIGIQIATLIAMLSRA